jgi:hypothetical protein
MSDPLLTGTFGLVVALITWLLTSVRERDKFRRDLQLDHIKKLENLYASDIESLELSIRITLKVGSYEEVEKIHSKNNALRMLFSTVEINNQSDLVSDLLHEWSRNYRQGQPKEGQAAGTFIIKSGDSEYVKKAAEVRPKLDAEILNLVRLMSRHLASERKSAKS